MTQLCRAGEKDHVLSKLKIRSKQMDEIKTIAEKALLKIMENITDYVFLEIQNDRELMQEYLRQLKENDAEGMNAKIGKYIKERLNLTNIGREEEPESTLIKSFEKHGLS